MVTRARLKNMMDSPTSRASPRSGLGSNLPLKSDLELSAYALYLAELTEQFTAENLENYPVLQLLLGTMQNLCQAEDRELLLRHFELHLLDQLGYRPQLHQCVSCRSALAPVINYFSSGAGGVLCPQCRQSQMVAYPLTADTLRVLQFLQDNDYDTARHLKVSSDLSRHVATLMRDYLRYLLERDLKSADWLDTIREQITGVTIGTT